MTPDWEDPRVALRRHGLRPRRGFSQNFLVARSVVDRIAEEIADDTATLVELGAGLGTLTRALLAQGARVIAVEQDRQMLHVLSTDLGSAGKLVVQQGDAADFDYCAAAAQAGGAVRVAGNLPYASTGAILRRLVEQADHIERAVLMIQREVRERLTAQPGAKAYGALSVFVTARYAVRNLFDVTRGSFYPAPKVTSSVVALTVLRPARARIDVAFEDIVRCAFQYRRKTLRNALADLRAHACEGRDPAVERWLRTVGIDPRRRGETLDVEEFEKLAALCREQRAATPSTVPAEGAASARTPPVAKDCARRPNRRPSRSARRSPPT